jgi:DNA-binding Lrp family transcriptional regulator
MRKIDFEILQILSKQPLLCRSQIAFFLGRGEQYIRKRVRLLLDLDFVREIKIRWDLTRFFLYPSDRGFHRLALHLGKTVSSLSKETGFSKKKLSAVLLKIEEICQARDFMKKIGAREAESPLPIRFSFGGKKFRLILSGGGLAEIGGKKFPFLLEWDRGEVEMDFYREKIRKIQTLSYSFPKGCTLIIVTINQRRAFDFLLLLDKNPPLFNCFVGERDEILGEEGAVWYGVRQARKVPLFFGSEEFSHFHEGEEEEEETRAPSRRIWIKEKKIIGEIEELGELERIQLHLNSLDRKILRKIACWSLMDVNFICSLLHKRSNKVYSSLKRLRELGLISEEDRLYFLSELGMRFLAASRGVPFKKYIISRGWGRRGKALGKFRQIKKHTLLLREIFLSFLHLVEKKREIGLLHSLPIWEEIFSHPYVSPDAFGIYRIGEESYEFFLEVDRGTLSPRRLERKIERYVRARELSGKPFPIVLFVVPSESRALSLREICLKRAILSPFSFLDIRITTLPLLREKGVGGMIWRKVKNWKRCYCFDGIGEPPPSAIPPISLSNQSQVT